jgi:hypothetical protein
MMFIYATIPENCINVNTQWIKCLLANNTYVIIQLIIKKLKQ